MLRFLHISDIHFATAFDDLPEIDIEVEVRARMLVDFALMRERCDGPFDAVLVVGDIAARGKHAEYVHATHFLENAAEIVGCASDQVICVPGNHDVDRSLQVPAHAHIRTGLRGTPPEQVSDALAHLLVEPLSAAVMFEPFTEYNKFAIAYDCDIGTDRPKWPAKTFELGDRIVKVHGMNSAWIADSTDSTEVAHQLVCGEFQATQVGSDPKHIGITLCHHPPNWLRDGALIKPWTAEAALVLTGHEHAAGLTLSEDGRTLYLASGAVNPERTHKGWIPAYNVIELELTEEPDAELLATIYGRTWQGEQGHAEFGPSPDHPDPGVHRIRVGAGVSQPSHADKPELVPELPPQPMRSAKHSQVHTIMRAAPDDRLRVARELGLELEERIAGLEADRAVLRLAHEQGVLAELAALLVQGAEEDV